MSRYTRERFNLVSGAIRPGKSTLIADLMKGKVDAVARGVDFIEVAAPTEFLSDRPRPENDPQQAS